MRCRMTLVTSNKRAFGRLASGVSRSDYDQHSQQTTSVSAASYDSMNSVTLPVKEGVSLLVFVPQKEIFVLAINDEIEAKSLLITYDRLEFCLSPVKYISMIVKEYITISRFVEGNDLCRPNSQCSYPIFILHKYKYFMCFTLLPNLSVLHARNKLN
jgi:hypothetical protein